MFCPPQAQSEYSRGSRLKGSTFILQPAFGDINIGERQNPHLLNSYVARDSSHTQFACWPCDLADAIAGSCSVDTA
jgi:hypothetical protein